MRGPFQTHTSAFPRKEGDSSVYPSLHVEYTSSIRPRDGRRLLSRRGFQVGLRPWLSHCALTCRRRHCLRAPPSRPTCANIYISSSVKGGANAFVTGLAPASRQFSLQRLSLSRHHECRCGFIIIERGGNGARSGRPFFVSGRAFIDTRDGEARPEGSTAGHSRSAHAARLHSTCTSSSRCDVAVVGHTGLATSSVRKLKAE